MKSFFIPVNMPCSVCTSASNGKSGGCSTNGLCSINGSNKLTAFNWLNIALPQNQPLFNYVEILFKNGRKEYFRITDKLSLCHGDVVAVEASHGHDIGIVALTGELVRLQMQKRNVNSGSPEIRQVYRKAHEGDIKKWQQARERERPALEKARETAGSLNLQMKISDAEFQGDNTKVTFYFTAEGRVDFRELIRILAAELKVRIEMRQIGLRQEAGRIGGCGDCGRELCCSTWLTDFRAVTTSAARYQQLSLNPDKLTGQCGKLKCCLNYELDVYVDALKEFPPADTVLCTAKGDAMHQKTDIFRKILWYTYKNNPDDFVKLSLERVKYIINENKSGKKPAELLVVESASAPSATIQKDALLQESVHRFDKKFSEKNQKNRKENHKKKKFRF